MDRAEQRDAGSGESDAVVLAGGSGGRLLRGLGDAGRQRCARKGIGELGQIGGLGGPGAQQTADEGPVEGVHGGHRLVEAGDGLGEQAGALHFGRTERVPEYVRHARPWSAGTTASRATGRGGGEFEVGQMAQESAEDGGRGLVAGRRGMRARHGGGKALRARLGLDPQIAGDALDAVLQHRLVDQSPYVVAERAARAAAGTVVVGAAGERVGAGRDRGHIDPLDVGSAGHHALQTSVGQFDERDFREIARHRGWYHPRRARLLPARQRTISFAARGDSHRLGGTRLNLVGTTDNAAGARLGGAGSGPSHAWREVRHGGPPHRPRRRPDRPFTRRSTSRRRGGTSPSCAGTGVRRGSGSGPSSEPGCSGDVPQSRRKSATASVNASGRSGGPGVRPEW